MATRLSRMEIQEIARLLEQGKALPEKYRHVLFIDKQPPIEDASATAHPEPLAEAERPHGQLQPQSNESDLNSSFVRFLLKDSRVEATIRNYESMIAEHNRHPNSTYDLRDYATWCVQSICYNAPKNRQKPAADIVEQPAGIDGHLSRWMRKEGVTPESARELFSIVLDRLGSQQSEIVRARRLKEMAEEDDAIESLLAKYADVVNTFLAIAERKVSVLDEYGDERRSLLPKLVDDCVARIAGREGENEGRIRVELIKGEFNFRRKGKEHKHLLRIRDRLPAMFAEYHQEQRGKRKTLEELASLSGIDFETAVGRVLLEHGWHVTATSATGDQGADIIATKGERKVIIQAKRYSGAVGNKAVQEVVGAILFYGGTEGCVVTNSTFTPAARVLAQKNNIRLIDGFRFHEIAEL